MAFLNTAKLHDWERADTLRLGYLSRWACEGSQLTVKLTDILSVVCNHGGSLSYVLAWAENQTPWAPTPPSAFAITHLGLANPSRSFQDISNIVAVVLMTVWLIQNNPEQFPKSDTFESHTFWYDPEDVSRAYTYLKNLRECRVDVLDMIVRPRHPIILGKDIGLGSVHDSSFERRVSGPLDSANQGLKPVKDGRYNILPTRDYWFDVCEPVQDTRVKKSRTCHLNAATR